MKITVEVELQDYEYCKTESYECIFLNDCTDHCHLFAEHLCVDVNGNYKKHAQCRDAYQKALEEKPLNPCIKCGKEFDPVKLDKCVHCGNVNPF